MKKLLRKLKLEYALAILASALLVGGAAKLFEQDAFAKEQDQPAQEDVRSAKDKIRLEIDATPITREGPAGPAAGSFSSVVKKVSPSVVQVYSSFKAKEGRPAPGNPFFDDPMFRRFFGEPGGNDHNGLRRSPQPKQTGVGSGVIVTKDGYILTNNHVVENADEVKVQIGTSGDEFPAKVIGADPKSDIAVLKIEAKDRSFPALPAADSSNVEVGDLVLAVGNPFGLGQTVTMGIVSATGRATLGLDYEDFIQTDAAINMGNSGGALVDAQGRLVGINTAILSRSGGNQGIGFAVPINLAKHVLESIVEHGRVIRGFMGVNIQDVTPALAERFSLKDREGALVAEVTPGSPADEAGVKSGDVILEFNGKPVNDSRHLKLQTAQIAPGREVPLKVSRDGKIKSLEVKLKEFPKDRDLAQARPGAGEPADLTDGITVDDLSAPLRQQFSIPSHVRGALVTDVAQDSAGFEAGLRPGDVILDINKQPVKNAEEAVAMTEDLKDDSVLLRVWSKGGSRFVVLKKSDHSG